LYNHLLKTYSIYLNKRILTVEVQEYINNYSKNISKLAFSGSPFEGITVQELIEQIESRKKAEKKLPTWFNSSNIYYPPKLNLEQTSSEKTAKYKASIINGNSIADITGGFGVDSFYFSEQFKSVHHFEINKSLSEIAKYNFKVFSKTNIECFSENRMLQMPKNKYDVIYIDPSRRHDSKGKVFFLRDCEPNLPDNLDEILKTCKQLLVKTSPMLDLSIGLKELKCVSEIHIVAVNNDVKELLWLINENHIEAPLIKTINITKVSNEKFEFYWNEKRISEYTIPKKYLYEPNAAIMKSGAFDIVSTKYKLNKLHQHAHLYTSNDLIDFPGRRFEIKEVIPFQKKEIKKSLKIKKANITTRNFPESVSTIRKKFKISDGGDDYLFFTTSENGQKIILVCSKV
jgi:hypothetical protein